MQYQKILFELRYLERNLAVAVRVGYRRRKYLGYVNQVLVASAAAKGDLLRTLIWEARRFPKAAPARLSNLAKVGRK